VLTGDPCTAADAAEAGLLSAVVDDEPSLDRWVAATVASLLKSAPGAVAATKALLRDLAAAPWDDGLTRAERISAELFAGPEAAEGMDAFLNKRAPSWVSEVR
jgi:enoyl-CoA hydratase/carnithine racemase